MHDVEKENEMFHFLTSAFYAMCAITLRVNTDNNSEHSTVQNTHIFTHFLLFEQLNWGPARPVVIYRHINS